MASAVASPLERQFTTIAGLDSMTSSSSAGSTNITLQFDLDRDIDSAAVDVQTAIAAVMPLLPPGMPSPPSFRKNNPADQPILMLNLTSNTLPMSALDDYAETMIAPRISMVERRVAGAGAGRGEVRGPRAGRSGQAARAAASASTKSTRRCRTGTSTMPTGQLFGPTPTYNIKAAGQLMNADAFRPIIVAYRNGAPVRLDRSPTSSTASRTSQRHLVLHEGRDGKPTSQRAITLQVMRQPGSNTIEVTDAVRALLPALRGAAAAVGRT